MLANQGLEYQEGAPSVQSRKFKESHSRKWNKASDVPDHPRVLFANYIRQLEETEWVFLDCST